MYELSRAADRDIEAILEYSLANFGIEQATRYYESLRDCLTVLGKTPAIGRRADHIRPGYFRFEHARHVIFYRDRPGGIFVVRILHERMDVTRHL